MKKFIFFNNTFVDKTNFLRNLSQTSLNKNTIYITFFLSTRDYFSIDFQNYPYYLP